MVNTLSELPRCTSQSQYFCLVSPTNHSTWPNSPSSHSNLQNVWLSKSAASGDAKVGVYPGGPLAVWDLAPSGLELNTYRLTGTEGQGNHHSFTVTGNGPSYPCHDIFNPSSKGHSERSHRGLAITSGKWVWNGTPSGSWWLKPDGANWQLYWSSKLLSRFPLSYHILHSTPNETNWTTIWLTSNALCHQLRRSLVDCASMSPSSGHEQSAMAHEARDGQ